MPRKEAIYGWPPIPSPCYAAVVPRSFQGLLVASAENLALTNGWEAPAPFGLSTARAPPVVPAVREAS